MDENGWSVWTVRASNELAGALASVSPGEIERMADEILAAGRILCSGAGREGLMVRALCMRLMHLGCDAHMVGDMTTPPVGPGDLLIVSAGPGHSAVQEALMDRAWNAGARTLVVTAQVEGPTPRAADVIIHLPAQTMADDTGAPASMLPMGTLFEWLELAFFDLLAIRLRDRTGQTLDQIRERHTNVE
ncbi:MAG: 6-phospho-3-hexuloisomerase [Chloroflexota bacterium]|nr:6-phospho-3-hexuloisomerase [Chloroflexia bacterium]MDQ3226970.1 6-phospho-3-hexuloisomerase [Chloroflexota bacterium]